jgi:N-acetylneuraminic acid mutarotase
MRPAEERLSSPRHPPTPATWRGVPLRHLVLLAALALPASLAGQPPRWEKLPSLPDPEGFAGCFAGVSGGALLVAGGTRFPGKKPWEGGEKAWYDTVFVLEKPDGTWRRAGRLPRALGYGVSVTLDDGVLCIGGASATRHHADCFLLRWHDGRLTTTKMPSLPRACAYLAGAKAGSVVYVAGGIEAPDSTSCLKTFWSLDLAKKDATWQERKPWPGPARILAVPAAHEETFFLLSGADLSAGKDGRPVRTYLRDAYSYDPDRGWRELPDLPRPVVAAASPAPVLAGRLLVVSGDDGRNVHFEPRDKHPGFPRGVLSYDLRDSSWKSLGECPLSRATVPAVPWRGRVVIPGGETRPGVRSPEVWGLTLP